MARTRQPVNLADRAEILALAQRYEHLLPGQAATAVIDDSASGGSQLGSVYTWNQIRTVIAAVRRRRPTTDYDQRLVRLRQELERVVPRQSHEWRVATALEITGLSQAWLARQCGADRVKVHRWVNGQIPRLVDAMAIARAFGVSADCFWADVRLSAPVFDAELDRLAMTPAQASRARHTGRKVNT